MVGGCGGGGSDEWQTLGNDNMRLCCRENEREMKNAYENREAADGNRGDKKKNDTRWQDKEEDCKKKKIEGDGKRGALENWWIDNMEWEEVFETEPIWHIIDTFHTCF